LLAGITAPSPVEYVLHTLASCLTTTMAFRAAARGIEVEAINSELEGVLDLRGLFGISDAVRKGYHHVRVTMRVRNEATVEQLG
jgi:uncharacterized OsmC-like protein